MRTLCLATHNAHKAEELRAVLGNRFEVKTLSDLGCHEEIPETGSTFEENSKIKADYVYEKYGVAVLADDSGLEVDALDGRPGVFSARYAGEPSDASANNRKLIGELQGKVNRSARFRTVITLIMDGVMTQFSGVVEGSITPEFNGEVGFGYNPVFVPEGYTQTFHEMSFEERARLNHRGQAMQKVLEFLGA